MSTGPRLSRRIACGVAAGATLVAGTIASLGLMVLDEEMRTPDAAAAPIPFAAYAVIAVSAGIGAAGWLGLAVVPARVIARGQRVQFVLASVLAGVTLLLAVPSPLAWPRWVGAALAAAFSVALLVRALRAARPSAHAPGATPESDSSRASSG